VTLLVLTHDACLLHDPGPGHPERPARLLAARRGIAASGVAHEIAQAPRVDLALARQTHVPTHVSAVEAACAGGNWIDADTYAGHDSWEAALRAAGAAVEAARAAERGEPAFALCRPPGHHATRASAMGFCLLNNVAIAAHDLTTRGRRVAIVDIDVHHGNGTQDIFFERADVLYVSLHGWPLYPGTGRAEETGRGAGLGTTLNIPLAAGTKHDAYLAALDGLAMPKVRSFAPDVILISVGFDADARDPLGNLALGPRTYHEAVAKLRDAQPRIAAILEGGYDLAAVEEGTAAVCQALVRI